MSDNPAMPLSAIGDVLAIVASLGLLVPLNGLRNLKRDYNKLKEQLKDQGESELSAIVARLQHMEDAVFSLNAWTVIPAGVLLLVALFISIWPFVHA